MFGVGCSQVLHCAAGGGPDLCPSSTQRAVRTRSPHHINSNEQESTGGEMVNVKIMKPRDVCFYPKFSEWLETIGLVYIKFICTAGWHYFQQEMAAQTEETELLPQTEEESHQYYKQGRNNAFH